MSLNAKSALVTGGEKGIGRGIVEAFLMRGMKVCIAGIDTDAAGQTLEELNAGERLVFCQTDVSDEDSVVRAVARAVQAFGGLDAAVANAGIADPGRQNVEDLSLAEWNRVIGTNLSGVFLTAKHCFPHLRRSHGAMVLIASTRAVQSEPGTTAYSATKGGVVALAHSLAITGGPEVRVNSISPGWIHTGDPESLREKDHAQHPAGRVGRPADIAGMAAYLISGEAGFITGQNFVVDGGMTVKMIYE